LAFAAFTVVVTTLPRFFDGPVGVELEFSPDALNGTWVSDDSVYADRFMTITADGILTIGLGADSSSMHPVRSIHARQEEDHLTYEIAYGSSVGDLVMTVFLHADGVLRLKNPSSVRWTREGADPAQPSADVGSPPAAEGDSR
jgi:hypothetical protein